MKNNNDLVKKLTSDVNKLQNVIEHRRLYNIRNLVVKSLLKSGIALDYALPFICAAMIANIGFFNENPPFSIDKVTEKARVETVDTSSGIHLEHISYDFSYDDELLEHSTGWVINDKGLYERTVTSYRIDDDIVLGDTQRIFSMTKEEIDQALVKTNVKTIRKNELTSEDMIYDSEMIIVTNSFESYSESLLREETNGENIWNSLKYIFFVFCFGTTFRNIEKLCIKTHIRDGLRRYEASFRYISKDELESMKRMLKLKQENLALVNGTLNNINEENGYSYRLRK